MLLHSHCLGEYLAVTGSLAEALEIGLGRECGIAFSFAHLDDVTQVDTAKWRSFQVCRCFAGRSSEEKSTSPVLNKGFIRQDG